MKNYQKLRFVSIVFVYLVAATTTFVDKLTFLDNWNFGINKEYWESNTVFFSTLSFWLNMFLFSILPAAIAFLIIKDRLIKFSTLALPIYWGFILYLSISAAQDFSGALAVDIKYFVYGFLFISTGVILVKLVLILISLRVEETIEDLEKFKERAMRKLAKLNPQHNQKLLENVLGNHGKALNLLIAANLEEDETEKTRLVRLALHEVAGEEDSLEMLEKRMSRYAEVKGE